MKHKIDGSTDLVFMQRAQAAQFCFHDGRQRNGNEILHVVLNFGFDQEVLHLDD